MQLCRNCLQTFFQIDLQSQGGIGFIWNCAYLLKRITSCAKALIAVFHCHILRSIAASKRRYERRLMCGLRKSLPCQFSFSSRHREIVGTYYWLLCGCFGVLFDELHAFHAHFNLRSRQFLDCFSFGICKVRDTAGRKLKRVQMILNEWCLGTALAWLGLNLKTNQKNGLLHRLHKLPFLIFTEAWFTSHLWWILSFLGQH